MTPDALAALCQRAYTHATPWPAAAFASALADPHTMLVTRAQAFVLGRVTLDEAEILALATDPTGQRRGAACAALQVFHQAAMGRGARRAFLEVAADNTPALRLYARAGYTQVGRRVAYYPRATSVAADAFILSRALT